MIHASVGGVLISDPTDYVSKKGVHFTAFKVNADPGCSDLRIDFRMFGRDAKAALRMHEGEPVVGMGRMRRIFYKSKKSGKWEEYWQLHCRSIIAPSIHYPPASNRALKKAEQFSGDEVAAMGGDPFALDE